MSPPALLVPRPGRRRGRDGGRGGDGGRSGDGGRRRAPGRGPAARRVDGSALPRPRADRGVGHLGRWGREPLALVTEGATLGEVFEMRLWRRVVVGWTPAWNQAVLGDLDTFRSRGGMSGMSPYLDGGIVQTDAPLHRPARRRLNPAFTRPAVATLAADLREVVETALPHGELDATEWSADLLARVLSVVMLGADPGQPPDPALAAFAAPLMRPLPHPLLPHPLRFRRLDRLLAPALDAAAPGSMAATLAAEGGVSEARVALAAAYDTTAHTLAFLLAHVAADPELLARERHASVIAETQRLYPAGWVGSRVAARDRVVEGVALRAGTMVLYSPYLTHRAPSLWERPETFDPERFAGPAPDYWTYLPFAAGERTCLGRHLATLVLDTVLQALADRRARGEVLTVVSADLTPEAGVTLRPRGPVRLRLTHPTTAARTAPPARSKEPQ